VVFIIADDLDTRTLAAVPRLQSLIGGAGLTFKASFVTLPLCAPSRATLLTGQYAHSHGVLSNDGFTRMQELGTENATIATALRGAGYRTVLAGKYMNNYPSGRGDTYVPPGWDEWYGVLEDRPADEFNYEINENGNVVHHGSQDADYQTDVLAGKVTDFIARTASDRQPFFMLVGVPSPHFPATPAPRHRGRFSGTIAPRTESFNEKDDSFLGKPKWLSRTTPLLDDADISELDEDYAHRLESLLAVEDLVDKTLQALAAAGKLENTYLFFTGDNGLLLGQHRFPGGKNAPYEESIRVPLMVRGPRVPAGEVRDHLVANVDWAPTLLELAGVPLPGSFEGRSMVPLLAGGPPSPDAWRKDFLVEHFGGGSRIHVPPYSGVREQRFKYVEYAGPQQEAYDTQADPDELWNDVEHLDAGVSKRLTDRLAALRACHGAACR
jgi:arylsulfatase A-like enzyme